MTKASNKILNNNNNNNNNSNNNNNNNKMLNGKFTTSWRGVSGGISGVGAAFGSSSFAAANGDVNTLPPQKSVIVAYFWWLIGGIFGFHHLYLHRDRHAFIWWCSLGGYFGIGWLCEIFSIPGYVRDANEDPRFIQEFTHKLRMYRKPPYSCKRFLLEVLIGYLFGQLYHLAIPTILIMNMDFGFLHWLIPLFVALGVWTVGNIGRERGVLWHCLLASYLCYPIRYIIYDETYTILLTTIVAALAFDHFSKEWLRTPPRRRGFCIRSLRFTSALCLYFTLWVSFLYFNGTITDDDGNEMPIHEAIQNFLASAWWTDLKQALIDLYNYAQHHGWYEIWKEIIESMDVDGERNAYKILNVSATATQSEITSAYRKLSKEYHPDKVKDAMQREEAQKRFIEVQQAYSVLSKIKSGRIRKNKKSIKEMNENGKTESIVL